MGSQLHAPALRTPRVFSTPTLTLVEVVHPARARNLEALAAAVERPLLVELAGRGEGCN